MRAQRHQYARHEVGNLVGKRQDAGAETNHTRMTTLQLVRVRRVTRSTALRQPRLAQPIKFTLFRITATQTLTDPINGIHNIVSAAKKE